MSHVSAMRRNCIQELDELFIKYEIERAAAVACQNGVIIMYRLCVSAVYNVKFVCFLDYCSAEEIHYET